MRRHGVSLLEVLFSIGVIAVGLLGITAVLPVALHEMGRGNIADEGLRIGQNGLNEFGSRGMANDVNWVSWDTIPNPDQWQTVAPMRISTSTSYSFRKYQAYAIDPMFVATNITAAGIPVTSATAYSYQFPFDSRASVASGPRMDRVSLMSAVSQPGTFRTTQTVPMNYLEAESIFTWQNELAFNIPDEKSLPPAPIYSGTPPIMARREYEGTYSWIATLAPKLNAVNEPRDTYLLSIVVFHRRNLAMELENERVVAVDTFYNSGYGGGDMRLQATTATDLELRAGQWVLMMGTVKQGNPPVVMFNVFRWYQISSVDSAPEFVSPNYEMDVTLTGSDWGVPAVDTQVGIISNVVAVYERSIRLEHSSLWSH